MLVTTASGESLDLDEIISKAVEKGKREAMAKVGSQSTKSLVKNLPKICIKTKEDFEALAHAAGHDFTTNFSFAYAEKKPSARDSDKLVGGYSAITSTEKVGYGKQVALFLRVAGLQGLADLDDVEKALNQATERAQVLRDAAEIADDVAAGLKAIYAQMVKGEERENVENSTPA